MKKIIVLIVLCATSWWSYAQTVVMKHYKMMPGVCETSGNYLIHYNMSAIMYAYNLLPADVQTLYKLPKWIANGKIIVSDKENKVLKQLLDKEVGAYLLMSGLAVVETNTLVQVRTVSAKLNMGQPFDPQRTPYSFSVPETAKVIFAGTMNNALKSKHPSEVTDTH